MNNIFENIEIREAKISDAEILINWCHGGKVITHALFLIGLGTNI